MKKLPLVLFVIAFLTLTSSPVLAQISINQLTDNSINDNAPSAFDGTIAWHAGDGDDSEIFYWDGTGISQITENDTRDVYPSLYDHTIAWESEIPDTRYTNSSLTECRILYWNGTTTQRVAYSYYWPTKLKAPSLYNGTIAWMKRRYQSTSPDEFDIFYWNGSKTIQIEPIDTGNDKNPSLSNGSIAWMEEHSTDAYNIFLLDGTSKTQITGTTDDARNPSLYHGTIAWEQFISSNEGYRIYYWDGSSTRQISENNSRNPSLYDGAIAWAASDGHDMEIYYWNGCAIIQVTDNNTDDRVPSLHYGILTWEGYDGNDWEIYYANIIPDSVNCAPIADAGSDQTVYENEQVTLDGSASSDPHSDLLTYQWSQIAGFSVTLDYADPVHPTFVAPEVDVGGATLTFQLIVNDGELNSGPDVVNVTVKNVNKPPVADAGDDQTVQEGSLVDLDGSKSYDPDNESITYSWTQTTGSSVTLTDTDTATPFFTAPLVDSAGETLTFELTIEDGIDSATDTVNVFVENVNHPPIADAGDDQTVDEGALVTLNGSESSDPDNDPLTFKWTQTIGSLVTLSNPSDANPSFAAPSVEPGGETLEFQVIVSDGEHTSVPDVVEITVLDSNDPPACNLAQASPDRLWPPNHKLVAVEIMGVTDPDNDQVTITVTGVTQDEPVNDTGDGDTGPDAVIQSNKVLLRAERAGDGNGRVYQVTFTADDGSGGICSETVTVCVPHDRRDTSCVDDDQLYDSLQP